MTQELTLGDLLEEPGVMTLDSWHLLGAVIFKNNHCFFLCVLRVVGRMLWGFGCCSKNINKGHPLRQEPEAVSILCAWNI